MATINTFAKVEFRVVVNKEPYSLFVPHGVTYADAVEAVTDLHTALMKALEESEKKEFEKKKDVEGEE